METPIKKVQKLLLKLKKISKKKILLYFTMIWWENNINKRAKYSSFFVINTCWQRYGLQVPLFSISKRMTSTSLELMIQLVSWLVFFGSMTSITAEDKLDQDKMIWEHGCMIKMLRWEIAYLFLVVWNTLKIKYKSMCIK